MFTYWKDLPWKALKFLKVYLLIADYSFQIFSQRYRLYNWVLTVILNALFAFVSVFHAVVWLLKLCTILGFLVFKFYNNGGNQKLKAWSFQLRKNYFCMLNIECSIARQSSIPFFWDTLYTVLRCQTDSCNHNSKFSKWGSWSSVSPHFQRFPHNHEIKTVRPSVVCFVVLTLCSTLFRMHPFSMD